MKHYNTPNDDRQADNMERCSNLMNGAPCPYLNGIKCKVHKKPAWDVNLCKQSYSKLYDEVKQLRQECDEQQNKIDKLIHGWKNARNSLDILINEL